jgi:Cd2+/Zn2+-exporting ATPase
LAAHLIAGGPILLRAGKNILRGKVFDENFLMALASVGAWAVGEFSEGVAVMLFYQLGEYFQEKAVDRSRRSIRALTDLRPDEVHILRGGAEISLTPEEAEPGDLFIIRPGERIPLDGIILEGQVQLDAQALTGESLPRSAGPGDEVLSGMISLNGVLKVKALRSYGDSASARILKMVEEAAGRKAKAETFITRFARFYTPAVVILALGIAFLPPLLFGQPLNTWLYRGLIFLVVSCPCALVISIPLTVFAGLGAASRLGILVKGGNYLETLAHSERVVFDKTGTITRGVFEVTRIQTAPGASEEELLSLAASAEKNSRHPLARAITAAFQKTGPQEIAEPEGFEEIRGLGVQARIKGRPVLAGSRKLLEQEGIGGPFFEDDGTAIHLAAGGTYLGCLSCRDMIKPGVAEALRDLEKLGLKESVVLTGDSPSAAGRISRELNLRRVYPSLLPDQKVGILDSLAGEKTGRGALIFAGDGINDAPALARADAGIAMGALGSDAAIEAADVVIMDDNLLRIPQAIRIARKTRRIVTENIILALGVKAVILAMGTLGWVGLWAAIFADVGTALLAIFNALRVTRRQG